MMTPQERGQMVETVMSLHDLISKMPEGVTIATVHLMTGEDMKARVTLTALRLSAEAVTSATAALLKKIEG